MITHLVEWPLLLVEWWLKKQREQKWLKYLDAIEAQIEEPEGIKIERQSFADKERAAIPGESDGAGQVSSLPQLLTTDTIRYRAGGSTG